MLSSQKCNVTNHGFALMNSSKILYLYAKHDERCIQQKCQNDITFHQYCWCNVRNISGFKQYTWTYESINGYRVFTMYLKKLRAEVTKTEQKISENC